MVMATIILSPAVTLDLIAIENDYLSFPFQVLDDLSNPANLSGYTSAQLTIKSNELSNAVIVFTSTGSTYQIDISNKSTGFFTVSCNSLALSAGVYQYDFEVRNNTKKITVMEGKFNCKSNITF